MEKQLDMLAIEKRAQQAAYEDGLVELLLGGFLVIYGAGMSADARLAPFVAMVIVFAKPLMETIKKRFIYPRSGYVKLRTENEAEAKGIMGAAVVFVILLLGALFGFRLWMGSETGSSFWLNYFMPAATGLMMAIGPFWLGQTYGLTRGYVMAGLFAISGFMVPILGIAYGYGAIGLMCMVMGGLALLFGSYKFFKFLRKYEPQEIAHVNH